MDTPNKEKKTFYAIGAIALDFEHWYTALGHELIALEMTKSL